MLLKINNLAVSDLTDLGTMFDKQDPCLKITVGKEVFNTARQKDAGIAAKFPETFEVEIGDNYENVSVDVEVLNESTFGSKTHIGKGSVKLSAVVSKINTEFQYSVDLDHVAKKGIKKKGKFSFSCNVVGVPPIESKNEEPKSTIPPVKDETLAAAVDPANAAKVEKTAPPPDTTEVSKVEESAKVVELSAPPSASASVGKKANVPVSSTSSSGENGISAQPQPDNQSKNGGSWCVCINKISANELKNVESFGGKNDPYVTLKLGDNFWKAQTAALEEGGSNVEWTYSPQTIIADAAMQIHTANLEVLSTEGLKVEVMDRNSMLSDVLIGETDAPSVDGGLLTAIQLKDCKAVIGANLPGEMSIVRNLNIFDKKHKPTGKVSLSCIMYYTPAKVKEAKSAVSNTESSHSTAKGSGEKSNVPFAGTGILKIKRLKCSNLAKVEKFGGNNDPYVCLEYGAWNVKTETKDDSGSDALFDYLDFQVDVTTDSLSHDMFSIQVYDKNNLLSDVLIGEGSINLASNSAILSHVNSGGTDDCIDVLIPLFNKQSKKPDVQQGKVLVTLQLSNCEAEAMVKMSTSESAALLTALPDLDGALLAADTGFLHIHRIKAMYLKLPKSMLGATSPIEAFLKLSFGDWSGNTPVIPNSKECILFDHLDIEIPLSPPMLLHNHSFTAEVWDKNSITSDTLIGQGSLLPHKFAAVGAMVEKEIEITGLNLMGKKGVAGGRLIVFASTSISSKKVTPEAEMSAPTYVVPSDFSVGHFHILNITAHGLLNTEYFGKQDPYVVVKFGEDWTQKTCTKDDEGANAFWDSLDFKCTVTPDNVGKDIFQVFAYDENTANKDVLIGSSSLVSLMKPVSSLNTPVDMVFELTSPKGKPAGSIKLSIVIKGEELAVEAPFADPATVEANFDTLFTEGNMRIHKIAARGLKGTSIVSSLQPYMVLKLGDLWMETIAVGSGTDPIWDSLILILEKVSPEMLTKHALECHVYEKTLLGDKIIGYGEFILKRCCPKMNEMVQLDGALRKSKDSKVLSDGRVSIFLSVDAIPVIAPVQSISEDDKFAEDFVKGGGGYLYISCIQGNDLKNTEFMGGKQDPFVVLEYGDWKQETDVKQDAGGNVIWNELEYETHVSGNGIKETPLKVTVWDKNDMASNALIGGAEISSLMRLVRKMGTEIELVLNIVDKKNKSAGKIVIRAELKAAKTEKVQKAPLPAEEVVVNVMRIRCFNLKNTELLGDMLGGKQDPYVIVKWGSVWEAKTGVLDNAGSEATWDFLSMRSAAVVSKDLQTCPLTVEVWDDNTATSDCLIGSASISLKSINELDKEKEFSVDIFGKNKKKNSGRISLFLKLEIPAAAVEEVGEVDLPPIEPEMLFSGGYFHVTRICAFELRNIEFLSMSKADPYIILANDPWTRNTCALPDAGANCIWNFLDMKFDVADAEAIKNIKPFAVTVNDKNSLQKDGFIGSGTFSIEKIRPEINKELEIAVPITYTAEKSKFSMKKDGGGGIKPAGRLVIYGMLKNKEIEEENLKLKEGFTFGTLQICRIQSFDLKNTEMYGAQDPFVVLSVGSVWTDKTEVKEEGGANVLWDFLSIQCEVFPATIENEQLNVVVWDENNATANAKIGSASVSFLRCGAYCGEEVELNVDLIDDAGKPSGRLVVYAKIVEEELSKAELPDSFIEGDLHVKRIVVSNLVKKLSAPYVKILLNEETTQTPDAAKGTVATWNHLDYHLPVDKACVKGREMMVEVWNNNKLTSDELIAKCFVPLKKAGQYFEEDVELFGKLMDKKDNTKEVGKVSLLVHLSPQAEKAESSELDLPDDFVVGVINISSVTAVGLKNTELFGKQDPYITFSVGVDKKAADAAPFERTETKDNGGSDVTWPSTNISVEVDRTKLANQKLFVTAMEENSNTADICLGSGVLTFRKIASRINNIVECTVNLSDDKGSICGKVTVQAMLLKADLAAVEEVLPETAVAIELGMLSISNIDYYNLNMVGALGMQKSFFVTLDIENVWNVKTSACTARGDSNTVSWTELSDTKIPVTGDNLRYKNINCEVFSSGVTGPSAVGTGTASLRRVGCGNTENAPIIVVIPVKEKNGKSAGTVSLSVEILEVDAQPTTAAALMGGLGGNELGKLQVKSALLSELKSSAMLTTKQTMYVELSMGNSLRFQSAVNAGVAKESEFKVDKVSQLAISQLQEGVINAKVFTKSMMGGSNLFGEAAVQTTELLTCISGESGEKTWLPLSSVLKLQGKAVGRIALQSFFVLDSDAAGGMTMGGDESVPDLLAQNNKQANVDIDELKSTCSTIKTQQGKMDKMLVDLQSSLKDDMHQQMAEERKQFEKLLAKQAKELKHALEAQTPQPPPDLSFDIATIEFPRNINSWRTAHVQAWLAYQVNLPQYAAAFQEASIDGLVLINHITDDTLLQLLDVDNLLHRVKIVESIGVLKKQQQAIDKAEADKVAIRLRRLQEQRKAEEDRKRNEAAARKLEKSRAKEAAKKKKKASRTTVPPTTTMNVVREQNALDRVKLEREMRLTHAKKKEEQVKADTSSKIWAFEYTGASKASVGVATSVWEDIQSDNVDAEKHLQKHGSKGYQDALSNIFQSDELNGEMATTGLGQALKRRTIPKNSSPEEILSVIKGAMYILSNRLVDTEKMFLTRKLALDSDMISVSDEEYLEEEEFEEGSGSVLSDVDDEDSLPPMYDDAPGMTSESVVDRSAPEYEDEVPVYEEFVVANESFSPQVVSSPLKKRNVTVSTHSHVKSSVEAYIEPITIDRIKLVYNTFVEQENNGAQWLGKNDKLTRLKLSGGIENILRLNLAWEQFDALWTRLDYARSGEIDGNEFATFFGDLSEYESLEGTQQLSLTSPSKGRDNSMAALTKCLYDLCDILRHAGFSAADMFSSFDRNGSGDISISEFCSMLRVVLGPTFKDKKLIYRSLLVIDVDGSKTISLNEILMFVYKIWKSQLNDLAGKLYSLEAEQSRSANQESLSPSRRTASVPGAVTQAQADSNVLISKLCLERQEIKDAIKKNFSREWRDKLEREGGSSVAGPFVALLGRMGLATTTVPASTTDAFESPELGTSNKHSTVRFSESTPSSPSKSSKSIKRNLATAGSNELKRYQIRSPSSTLPTRIGAKLTLPSVYSLNKTLTGETTDAILKR